MGKLCEVAPGMAILCSKTLLNAEDVAEGWETGL